MLYEAVKGCSKFERAKFSEFCDYDFCLIFSLMKITNSFKFHFYVHFRGAGYFLYTA